MKNIALYSFLLFGCMLMSNKTINAQSTTDITSWEVLANVEWEIDYYNGLYKATFAEEIEELNEQEVIVKGYLFPLGYGMHSSEFLLTPNPIGGCFYCVPGSSETMIYLPEVKVDEFPYSEVSIKGKFHLVRDNPYGLIYEMKDVSVEE